MVSLEVYDTDGEGNHKFRLSIATGHLQLSFEPNGRCSEAERLGIARDLRVASNLLLGLVTDGGTR